MSATDLRPRAQRMFRGSFWLFVFAEAMIFVTLFSTRFLLAGRGHPAALDNSVGLAITGLLVVSLAPLYAGRAQARLGSGGAGMLWLTAFLGLVALVLIVRDWTQLPFPLGGRYGENYVLSTFYHALHIGLGLVGLLVVGAQTRRGAYPATGWPVGAAATFWSFVVVSWVALYLVFYVA